MRRFERSPTSSRPRESKNIVCGTLNSPGPSPRLPQALMNVPSFANLTMRELTWPSETKMSPLGATATSVGLLKVSGAVARHAFRAEGHQQPAVARELEHLLADAVAGAAVGDPQEAVAIDADAGRPHEHLLAPRLQQLARGIELDDRRLGARE